MIHHRRVGLVVLLGTLLFLVWLYAATYARAARSTASCWFADGWLYAMGLPITYPYSVTTTFYPSGTTSWSIDGTLAVETWATDAYFWVRGHGPSNRKVGPQLNDYHLIAECHA
jgi:hypothetical protein